jgi:hypothetical protein
MDMLMLSEVSVEAVAQNFLKGNYDLDMAAMAGPETGRDQENSPPADSAK